MKKLESVCTRTALSINLQKMNYRGQMQKEYKEKAKSTKIMFISWVPDLMFYQACTEDGSCLMVWVVRSAEWLLPLADHK